MIGLGVVFLFLAAIALLGFLLDVLFHRLHVTSIVPLLLIGVAVVQLGALPSADVGLLERFNPYIDGLTVAFVLFSVGLELRIDTLAKVVGRATAFLFGVQLTTGLALAGIAVGILGWPWVFAIVFGFALSGPSSVIVPRLVRVATIGDALRAGLLYESVLSDVLQLLVPLLVLGVYVQGHVSFDALATSVLVAVVGSAAAGFAAGVLWLLVLDRFRFGARGYFWTLTITIVLATYGASDLVGLNPAVTIFAFGVLFGNALALGRDAGAFTGPRPLAGMARALRFVRVHLNLSPGGLDLEHVRQVQTEVTFFASTFFFVYLGLLFEVRALSLALLALALAATAAILAVRFLFAPLLAPYLSADTEAARSERALVVYNVGRGLSPAIVATLPLSFGIAIPHFLDAIFLVILVSILASSAGIGVFYRPQSAPAPPAEAPPLAPAVPAPPAADPRPPLPDSAPPVPPPNR